MWRLVLALGLVALTWSGRASATRRALVVGDNLGVGPDAPLRFAEDDAAAVARTLSDAGAVAPGEVTLLNGSDLVGVRAAVRGLAARSTPDDELVVFFSGHGGNDGAHVAGQVWAWNDFRADLESVRARFVAAFVDACFSGALLTAKGLERESPLTLTVAPLGGRGHYLVTSSGANELSYESGLLQGSPFAAALRSGMLGAADANADGEVSLPELYGYVYDRTLSATVVAPTGPQHPLQSVQLESAGEVVLVPRRRGVTGMVRGAAGLGRCYLLDREGARVVAELERATERVLLPPAEYLVKCLKGLEVHSAHATLGAEPIALDALQYTAEAPTGQLAKGGAAASFSRLRVGAGIVSGVAAGAFLVGYEGGSSELLASVAAGATTNGGGLLLAGAGMHVPWWRFGGTRAELGLEAAAHLANGHVSLGGGSFVEVQSPRVGAAATLFARLDLLATHPVDGGSLGSILVGSLGVELGP